MHDVQIARAVQVTQGDTQDLQVPVGRRKEVALQLKQRVESEHVTQGRTQEEQPPGTLLR